jgi:hypothetical protein
MKSMRSIAFGALAVVALYCVARVLLPGRQAPPPAGPPSTGSAEGPAVRLKPPVRSTERGRRAGPARLSPDERPPPISHPGGAGET